MTETETFRVFLSGEPRDSERLSLLLGRLNGVDLVEVPETRALTDQVGLPMLEGADGRRYVGLDAIETFVAGRTGS